VALLPGFAEALHAGKGGLGLLRAAPALGSVLMGLAIARFGELRRAGPVLLWCVALFGVTWILFALSPWLWLSVLLLVAGGAVDCVSMVVRGTLVQTSTPQEKMGRVSAVNSLFIGSSNEVGEFESGVAARLLGVVPSVVFGGTMTLVTVALVAWRVPALRRLRRIRAEVEPAPAATPAK
jgi:MFS family permease